MRPIQLLLWILLPLILSSGCRLNDKYVEADRATYNDVAHKTRRLLAKERLRDPEDRELDEDEMIDLELYLDIWDLRLRRAEKFLGTQKDPTDSIWEGW